MWQLKHARQLTAQSRNCEHAVSMAIVGFIRKCVTCNSTAGCNYLLQFQPDRASRWCLELLVLKHSPRGAARPLRCAAHSAGVSALTPFATLPGIRSTRF